MKCTCLSEKPPEVTKLLTQSTSDYKARVLYLSCVYDMQYTPYFMKISGSLLQSQGYGRQKEEL